MTSDEELPPDPFPNDSFLGDLSKENSPNNPGNPQFDPMSLLGGLGGVGAMGAMSALGDLSSLFSQGTSFAWDNARQIAIWAACKALPEANVEPMARITAEKVAAEALGNINEVLGTNHPLPRLELTTRSGWAAAFLSDAREFFELGASSLAKNISEMDADDSDSQRLGDIGSPQITSMIAPIIYSTAVGTGVGQFATQCIGTYDIILNRAPLSIVPAAIKDFATEWALNSHEVLAHVVIHDLVTYAILQSTHISRRIEILLNMFLSGTQIDFGSMLEDLSTLGTQGGSQPQIANVIKETPAQAKAVGEIAHLLAPIVGYIEHVTMFVGAKMMGDNRKVAEAFMRRNAQESQATSQLVQLLPLRPTKATIDLGRSFAGGVIQRCGLSGLGLLLEAESNLPTPSELAAPGLWLARLEL